MTDAPKTTTLKISHSTTYRWTAPISYALQQLRLTPKSRSGQQVLDWTTKIDGGQVELEFDDCHHNRTQLVSANAGQQEITITAQGTVRVTDQLGVIGQQQGYMPLWMFLRATDLTRRGSGTLGLVRDLRDIESPLDQLHALATAIRETVRYDTGEMDVTQTAEEAVAAGIGVCQDHAHIFVTCARLLDVPARYVSGYLRVNEQDDQDATHAWAEAHIEGLGWVGFDVSNGISPDERYVRVATGLDYSDAAPISGVRSGAGLEAMDVSVSVAQAQQ
ncbi:Transglutaminase-like enzyme, putative cysteine protease [Jannaschia faecimaris]|uniref:Transglutaminase-like enzyme, putative cysteine protease n=1 Tax=Jannaschia faecimaris TaxID=1244108 RepID=A0A1H3PME4_9RHOB|nr:transglutaminase family protein [Jannaschia faecimaris]SDZ02217.1 Transglutaminase-like enzyme, putative cysteine protease [Jannaschia faecimaris]